MGIAQAPPTFFSLGAEVSHVSAIPAPLASAIEASVIGQGLHLLELRLRGARSTSVLEIIVDAEERSVTLDELGALSRSLADLLDEKAGELPPRYRLEVSSGGLDRPLEHPWQYLKNIGRLLRVRMPGPDGTPATALYRLQSADTATLTLLPAGSGAKRPSTSESIVVPLADIERATVEPEL